ncbi:MAG: hypothetical protein R6V06_03540 [Kiritimatiellia bacterium]
MMKFYRLIITVFCLSWIISAQLAAYGKTPEKKYNAIIIQAAGYPPEGEKPEEGTDAVTQATTKGINTYTLTTSLIKKLNAADIAATVLPHTSCKDLKCLTDGSRGRTDLLIFAGPSHFSKQPPQLTKLYRRVKDVVKTNPKLICSTLVPAWYPDTKGKDTIKVAAKAFEKEGASVVEGVSILTPRGKKKGADTKEVEAALIAFTDRISAALSKN